MSGNHGTTQRLTPRRPLRANGSTARFFRPFAEKLEDRLLLATDVFFGTELTLTLEIGGPAAPWKSFR